MPIEKHHRTGAPQRAKVSGMLPNKGVAEFLTESGHAAVLFVGQDLHSDVEIALIRELDVLITARYDKGVLHLDTIQEAS